MTTVMSTTQLAGARATLTALYENNYGDVAKALAEVIDTEGMYRELWRDAYHIAWVGACNPSGVEYAISKWVERGLESSTPVRAMKGHLEFLRGNGLGPEMDDLSAIKRVYEDEVSA